MQGLVQVFGVAPEPQPMAQKLPGRVQSVLLVHGVATSQQESLSQQAVPPPATAAQWHCSVRSLGHVLATESQVQAPLTHSPLGLQQARFVPALQTAPPASRQRRFAFLLRALASSERAASKPDPESAAPRTVRV